MRVRFQRSDDRGQKSEIRGQSVSFPMVFRYALCSLRIANQCLVSDPSVSSVIKCMLSPAAETLD